MWGPIGCGTLVIGIGRSFVWLRSRFPLRYAFSELGAAFAFAADAAGNFTYNRAHAVLALLAAIFVAVRGFDDLKKAQRRKVARGGNTLEV